MVLTGSCLYCYWLLLCSTSHTGACWDTYWGLCSPRSSALHRCWGCSRSPSATAEGLHTRHIFYRWCKLGIRRPPPLCIRQAPRFCAPWKQIIFKIRRLSWFCSHKLQLDVLQPADVSEESDNVAWIQTSASNLRFSVSHLVRLGVGLLYNLNILFTEEVTGQQVVQEALDTPQPARQQQTHGRKWPQEGFLHSLTLSEVTIVILSFRNVWSQQLPDMFWHLMSLMI